MKSIVSKAKHKNFNDEPSDRGALIQEIETRFDTTFDMLKRFIPSFNTFKAFLLTKSSDPAEKMQHDIKKLFTGEKTDEQSFPAQKPIITVFAPIRHKQTELKASNVPTLMKTIAMLEEIKLRLSQIFQACATL